MKKAIVSILSLFIAFSAFAGCGDKKEEGTGSTIEASVYSISLAASQGGTLTADKESVNVGESVTLTLTPDEGYVLQSLIVNGGKVTPVKQTVEGKTSYTWKLTAASSDLTASAVFALPGVRVSFNANGGVCDTTELQASLNQVVGTLPQPYRAEHRFAGWFDENGNRVEKTTVMSKQGDLNLTAKWTAVSEEEKAGVQPYSLTTTYYDMAATKYGVVWHTEGMPIASVIQAVEKPAEGDFPRNDETNEIDFTNATNTFCSYDEFFYDHYITTGVLEGLKFGTTYAVRVGDIVGNRWSETYEFTTREEQVDFTKFIYLCDTQEDDSFGNRPAEIGNRSYQSVTLQEATARFPDSDFIAHGGDFFNFGSDLRYIQQMLDSNQPYSFKYPLHVTSGNHEGDNWYSMNMENLSLLFNYDAMVTDNLRGDFYSFDFGPLHFVTLRSNDVFTAQDGKYGYLSPEQIEWLVEDLESVDRRVTPWVITMLHDSPIQYGGAAYASTMGPQLMPILTENNVDLMLYGHNHFVQSTYPVIWKDGGLANTTTAKSTATYEGLEVDKIDYSGIAAGQPRGTVFHEIGVGGYQYTTQGYKAEVQSMGIQWRKVFGGGASAVAGIPGIESRENYKAGRNYTMYSYVEVSANQLVVRTYGVDALHLAAETDVSKTTSYGVYFEGFMLNK